MESKPSDLSDVTDDGGNVERGCESAADPTEADPTEADPTEAADASGEQSEGRPTQDTLDISLEEMDELSFNELEIVPPSVPDVPDDSIDLSGAPVDELENQDELEAHNDERRSQESSLSAELIELKRQLNDRDRELLDLRDALLSRDRVMSDLEATQLDALSQLLDIKHDKEELQLIADDQDAEVQEHLVELSGLRAQLEHEQKELLKQRSAWQLEREIHESTDQSLSELRDNHERTCAELRERNIELAETRHILEASNVSLEDEQVLTLEMRGNLELSQNEAVKLNDEVVALRVYTKEIGGILTASETENSRLTQKLERLVAERDDLVREVTEGHVRLWKALEDERIGPDEIDAAKKALHQTTQGADQAFDEVQTVRWELSTVQEQLADEVAELQEVGALAESSSQTISEFEAKLASHESRISDVITAVTDLHTGLTSSFEELTQGRSKLDLAGETLQKIVWSARSRMDEISSTEESLNKHSTRLEELAKNVKSGDIIRRMGEAEERSSELLRSEFYRFELGLGVEPSPHFGESSYVADSAQSKADLDSEAGLDSEAELDLEQGDEDLDDIKMMVDLVHFDRIDLDDLIDGAEANPRESDGPNQEGPNTGEPELEGSETAGDKAEVLDTEEDQDADRQRIVAILEDSSRPPQERLGHIIREKPMFSSEALTRQMEIEPKAAFILSRMDGTTTFSELIDMSGLQQIEAAEMLIALLLSGFMSTGSYDVTK